MGRLFFRRRRPAEHDDCRFRDAWLSARGRAAARTTQARHAETEARVAVAERDRLRTELAAARELVDELERELRARPGMLDAPVVLSETGMEGLAAELVVARRRATAATQRAGLAEKRGDQLDDLLTTERRRREELELQLAAERLQHQRLEGHLLAAQGPAPAGTR